MRRKTVRLLANVGRAVALSGCLLGGAVALLWRTAPDLVATIERDLRTGPADVAADLQRARAGHDPVARESALRAVLAQLTAVRAGQRLAPFAVECRRQLAMAAARRGDLAVAMACWREAVAFDPLDAEAAANLAELESTGDGAGAAAAAERLAALLAMAPTSATIVAANVRALLRDGKVDPAIAVLRAAMVPAPQTWSVAAGTGSGELGTPMLVAAAGTSPLRLPLLLADATRHLRFVPAVAFAARPAAVLRCSFPDGRAATVPAAWTADGAIEVSWTEPASGGLVELEIAADAASLVRVDVAWVALDPLVDRAVRAAARDDLRRIRAMALAGEPLRLRAAATGGDLVAAPALVAGFEFGDTTTTATWRLPRAATELRFELPGRNALHRWTRLADAPFAPADIVASGDVVVHADGIEVVGPQPWLQVRLREPRDHVVVELLP
ncbi:MAG: hypothetical protein JNK15_02455 [Planctomycetes bacterium]|nr:hypothetical protein [Planctomycetota bacterium]